MYIVLHQSVGTFLIVMVTTSGEVSKQNFYKRSHAKTCYSLITLCPLMGMYSSNAGEAMT